MRGILNLVSSKNDPVFGPGPVEIEFMKYPRLGEPFVFLSKKHGFCVTSEVKAIDSETGEYLLTTRNSIYKLRVENGDADRS